MSNYTKTTNFTAKDALSTGDPNKVIKGSEHDTEFDNIETASATKANKVVSGTTNAVITQTAGGDLQDSGYILSGLSGTYTLASSDDVVDNFPSGTLMLFQQTAAPTGWTKATTHNDKALRVVSGTASSGGTNSFTTALVNSIAESGAVGDHQLTVAEMPAHSHVIQSASNTTTGGFQSTGNVATTDNSTDSTGGDGTHSHTLQLNVQYVDLIIASKD